MSIDVIPLVLVYILIFLMFTAVVGGIIATFEQFQNGVKTLRIIALTIIIFLMSCSKLSNEETFCWTCTFKETYLDSNNVVVNWYKESFEICDRSQYQIYIFETRNMYLVDTARMIGAFIECQKQ